jgi:NADH-quinone oxidoreductase subunit J
MILTWAFFYLFAALILASGVMVISARNPVHAVLFLIVAFFNSAGLFVLMGAEFIAMILVIVYVGAVAVLFLFVVMMLDIDFVELKQGFLQYLPIGALIGVLLLVELLLVLGSWVVAPQFAEMIAAPVPPLADVSNTEAIGRILYTKYVYFFQSAGLILLVAMVGAIVLTLHHKVGVKRQSVAEQIARDPATAIEIKKVEPGKGI